MLRKKNNMRDIPKQKRRGFPVKCFKGCNNGYKESDATDNVIKARAIVHSGGAKKSYNK